MLSPILILTLLTLLIPTVVQGKEAETCKHREFIKVTGLGRGTFKTTISEIKLSVDVTGPSKEYVENHVSRNTTSIVVYLRKHNAIGLKTDKVTLFKMVHPRQANRPHAAGQGSLHSHDAEFSSSVVLSFDTSVTTAGKVLRGVLRSGATFILSIHLKGSASDLEYARHEAINDAVRNARAEAGAVALGTGKHITSSYSVDIRNMFIPRPVPAVHIRGVIEPAVEIVPCKQSATAIVTVTYGSRGLPVNGPAWTGKASTLQQARSGVNKRNGNTQYIRKELEHEQQQEVAEEQSYDEGHYDQTGH